MKDFVIPKASNKLFSEYPERFNRRHGSNSLWDREVNNCVSRFMDEDISCCVKTPSYQEYGKFYIEGWTLYRDWVYTMKQEVI